MNNTTTLARVTDASVDAERILVSSFLAGYREPTRSTNKINVNQFADWCHQNGITLLEVKRAHIEAYARYLEEVRGLMLTTVANKINTVRQLYKIAHRDQFLEDNPAQWVKPPSIPSGSNRHFLIKAELHRLLDAARELGPQEHALLALMAYTGMRVGELCALNVEHLGTKEYFDTVRINREKKNRAGEAPLNPRVSRALKHWIGTRKNGPLFLNRNEVRMDRRGVDRILKRACKLAGITDKNITPHSLRHSFITIFMEEGGSERDLVQSMGYASSKMIYKVYDHYLENLNRHATHKVFAAVEAA